MQTACTRADELLAGAPLDNSDVDSCQRQLRGQHQPCWTTSGDYHCMLGHRHTPIATSESRHRFDIPRDANLDNTTRIS